MDCWFFFFFKQKTAYEMRISDWSSDVCSSDLASEVCITGFNPISRPSGILRRGARGIGSLQSASIAAPSRSRTRDESVPDREHDRERGRYPQQRKEHVLAHSVARPPDEHHDGGCGD